MKDDDDYNIWRDTFGYHDEDFDGDVDLVDVDIADRRFKELEKILYPETPFDDDEDDEDDKDDEWDDDNDEDEDLFEDDDEDISFESSYYSSRVSPRHNATLHTQSVQAPPVSNVVAATNIVGESVSRVKPLEQTKVESKALEMVANNAPANVANNSTAKQAGNADDDAESDRLAKLITKWLFGIFFIVGGKTCETIGTIFLLPLFIFIGWMVWSILKNK
jgi:hypothetical protein